MLYLSSDHAGFELKENLKNFLLEQKIEFEDLGCDSEDRCDYPDFGHKLAEKVLENPENQGIGVCGSGLGISMALNRHSGIRAARCTSIEDAELGRKHNNANVLALAGRQTKPELAQEMLLKFLETEFEGGRHEDRIKKIELLKNSNLTPTLKIAPSILSADFGKLNEEVASIEPFCEWLHLDVMDGNFVPNLSFGAPVVKCLKTKLFRDCHLMVNNPEILLEDFAKAGADAITIHSEIEGNISEILKKIKDLGCQAGISIKPQTPLSEIEKFLPDLDLVLIMSVEPGFGGQEFMTNSLDKIRELREKNPELEISIDGGINSETAKLAIEAGASVLVAGSYIFKSEDREKAIASLRN
jgi:ribulose-phosphate 3-epimerase